MNKTAKSDLHAIAAILDHIQQQYKIKDQAFKKLVLFMIKGDIHLSRVLVRVRNQKRYLREKMNTFLELDLDDPRISNLYETALDLVDSTKNRRDPKMTRFEMVVTDYNQDPEVGLAVRDFVEAVALNELIGSMLAKASFGSRLAFLC